MAEEWPSCKSCIIIIVFICHKNSLEYKHSNKHGNGLPEKPTDHQAGGPDNRYTIIKHDNKEL